MLCTIGLSLMTFNLFVQSLLNARLNTRLNARLNAWPVVRSGSLQYNHAQEQKAAMDEAGARMQDTTRQLWSWYSPNMEQTLSVARWGWYGKPVLFFPTGGGDFLDCERFLIVRALSPLIEAGRIKLYAVESASRTWLNSEVTPRQKTLTQARYSRYLEEELCPFIRSDCGGTGERFVATGASLGGYDALNAVARRPDLFSRMIGMSGTYMLDRRVGTWWDVDYYFNDPVQFLPRLKRDTPQYRQLQTCHFILARGSGPHEATRYIERVAGVLQHCDIPHRVEIWGKDADHDWPTWRTMLPLFLDRLTGHTPEQTLEQAPEETA